MTWVADTSWLYALVDAADPHHAKAREEARQPEPVEVPEVILAETLDLIRYRHGRKAALAALEGFERLPHFVLGEHASHVDAATLWRSFTRLSYADAVAVGHAKARGFELRTFDRTQVKALQSVA
jgi:predicted nucleic acid-binding protein